MQDTRGINDVLIAVNDYSMRDFIKQYYFIREPGIAENVNDIIPPGTKLCDGYTHRECIQICSKKSPQQSSKGKQKWESSISDGKIADIIRRMVIWMTLIDGTAINTNIRSVI